jgi:RecB family exonuclease
LVWYNDWMKYSHTKLDVARQCMKKFKFQYIDKIKIEEEDTTAADFGNIIHEIAEKYTGGGKEQLLALYHEVVPSKYPMPEKYRQKLPMALRNVHSYWESVLSAGCEKIDHELDTTIDLNEEISLNGKIDLIIQKDGRYRIGDYKTAKSKEYANHTSQLAIYMLLLNKKFDIPYEKMDCEIIYLALDPQTKRGVEVLNEGYENISKIYKLEESDVECLIAEINMIHSRIQKSIDKGEWSANPTKFNCTYCKFKSLCDKKMEGC